MTRLGAPRNIGDAQPEGGHGVLMLLAALSGLALLCLPWLTTAPNRLVKGEPLYLAYLLVDGLQSPVAGWTVGAVALALTLAAVAALLSLPSRSVLWAATALIAALMPGLLWFAGSQAEVLAQTGPTLARTSLASGFWAAWLLWGLLMVQALQRLALLPWMQGMVVTLQIAPLAVLLVSGACDHLSVVKEFHNRADVFWPALAQHAVLVALSLGLTVVVGLAMGWLAHRRDGVRRVVMPALNVLQTVPSIALFGLLMSPLAWLGSAFPALGQAGIGGVGLVPAVVALTVYGLLPVVRGAITGLAHVPAGTLNAARSLGLTPAQSLRWVALPLALPLILGGVRTAAVQQVGLAAVAALIGAGGLGAIMFEGLFSAAQDLVLLGVLPVIVLGVWVDAAFGVLTRCTRVMRVRALIHRRNAAK